MAREKFISNNDEVKSNTKMADRRKAIEKIYGGSDEGIRRLYNKASGSNVGNRFNEKTIKQIIDQVGTESINKKTIYDLSNFAYATDSTFAGIIDYLSNMFTWRYYYFPVQTRDTAKESEYKEIYNLMTEIVDGLSLEVTMPTLIAKLLREGSVYLYAVRNRPSKTISTVVLNSAYCKPIMMSQYGTGIFQFDLKYFDDLGFRGEELEEVLEYFPEELVGSYREYKQGGPQKIVLDGRSSTYLSTNEYGFPSHLSSLKSIFDYNQYRTNEVERNTAQLDKIITHKIPAYENRLLFELPEVQSLHKSMSKSIANNSKVRLMTTFGEVEIHDMQEASKVSNETLEKAQEAIYRTSGLNSSLFMGKTKESLDISLTKDQSTIWKYVQQLMNFYNLTINNLYNFRGYQIELTMLPATHYNQKEMMETYRRNGEYGIGRLEAIVASGTKQRHINHKSKLEEFLELDKVLKPLASSHTQSGKQQVTEEEVDTTSNTPVDDVVKDEPEKADDE